MTTLLIFLEAEKANLQRMIQQMILPSLLKNSANMVRFLNMFVNKSLMRELLDFTSNNSLKRFLIATASKYATET